LNRYNVHFEFDEDIEISVIVETEETDEILISRIAKTKLEKSGLSIVTTFERKYIIDFLESIKN
jgi:hypothetical protein